jgi:predicted DNA binding CopG/RHH family protein
MEKVMKSKKIPKIDSIQELSRFWDTHDLTDFEDDLQEVTEPIFRREALIRIRLPQNKLEGIKEIAKSRGIEYTELIQQWVTEKAEAP